MKVKCPGCGTTLMTILFQYIIPGIVLGLLIPKGAFWWSYLLVVPAVFAVIYMIVELVRGKAKARVWRHYLSAELDTEENSEIVELAVLRASITHQFIYKFHFLPFVGACLLIAVPVAILSAITYGLRCWLG